MQKQPNLECKRERYMQFLNQCKTMVISTVDENGDPFISYAPFVIHEGHFYIFISKISEHFRYIEDNSHISVMMLADEKESPNLFARERVRFTCTSECVGNDGQDAIFAKFEHIYGSALMRLLRTIDMYLFKLTPIAGRYVVGFGEAFEVNMQGTQFTHVVVEPRSGGKI
ncbi:HugZ family pyridoxamine 5'-phosphate oxidase [Anoxybacillus sp. J5B_2022]|uniref:HugZ family pyridoxamine 5'-phosphate oxidase n=1 Tax=Anoxybacillus sp. J5B_2022 TaxID=3003246 RepID=UPI002286A003|nr:pyridoxamine 5'-phosphate oxidase family protein [Anoxybacillus sp. J5B_2022]MCL6587436.1 pyridoxamine 5'-phosphate oxidase family protein [Anoxybacillus sp.]MCZ0756223.1 pyridoxamine 5'-phosphate oxidase family protein [Anoxybacillus sp. J5B_2022]